jgi:hypothetical protein
MKKDMKNNMIYIQTFSITNNNVILSGVILSL